MSRKHHDYCSCKPVVYRGGSFGCESKGSDFGLVGLVILILIILQFKKGGFYKDYKLGYDRDDYEDRYQKDYDEDDECDDEDDEDDEYKRDSKPSVDNGILFIIALFYLACCGKKW